MLKRTRLMFEYRYSFYRKIIFFLSCNTAIKITETRTIYVITTMVENKEAPCTVVIEMPSGKRLELTMIRVIEGYTAVFTPTELGEHKFYITYAEMYIPASPITVMVEVVIEMTKVLVRGLESRKYSDMANFNPYLRVNFAQKPSPIP